MAKTFTFFCAVALIAVVLCVGGVFAVFAYAQAAAEPKSEVLNKDIAAFEYPSFTQDMVNMMNYADGTNTHGLNVTAYYAHLYDPSAPKIEDGVMHAYAQTVVPRKTYGYVGSMDSAYGTFFNAADSIAVVMRYAVKIGEDTVVYLYMANKKELDEANVGDTINVFRVGYKYTEKSASMIGYYLIKDAQGKPVIEKGTSPVQLYEGQTDGAKTFGVYNGNEIFVLGGK